MTDFMASFAMKLDGKTPPQKLLPPGRRREAEALVSELDQWDLLRHTRILDRGLGTVYWTIFFFEKNTKLRVPCRILNALLQLFFFPAFLIGIAISCDYLCSDFARLGISLPGMIVGGILGIIAHEAGHTIAGISYRAAVYEFGVMIDHFLPGAYVMVDTKNLENKQHIIQIDGAGLEANFLLAGVFLVDQVTHFSSGVLSAILYWAVPIFFQLIRRMGSTYWRHYWKSITYMIGLRTSYAAKK